MATQEWPTPPATEGASASAGWSIPTIYKPQKAYQKRGLLIAGEGLDGSGKTTFMKHLQTHLEARGQPVVLSNWNDTTEMYNLMMRLNAAGDLTREMRCIFGAAELAARYHYIIMPALDEGRWVLVNKYLTSLMAHALIRGHDLPFLQHLYSFAYGADLILYVDVPPEVALQRKLKSGKIGFWEAGLDLALDVPLEEALRVYQAGDLHLSFLGKCFLEFQQRLRCLHWELLQGQPVLYLDGTLAPETNAERTLLALDNLAPERMAEDQPLLYELPATPAC